MVQKEDLLEVFITFGLEGLYDDFSDDGDGELELTEEGNEIATTVLTLLQQEIDKAREEGFRLATDNNSKWMGVPTVVLFARNRENSNNKIFRARLISDDEELLDDIHAYISKTVELKLKNNK